MPRLKFEEMRSPEIGELAERRGMVLLPIGACEEHSRHLPVITDTRIAHEASMAAAREAADRIPLAVLPPVWFGYASSRISSLRWTGRAKSGGRSTLPGSTCC